MTEPLSPQALAWLRQSVLVDGSTYSRVLLHLLERVEALEARPIPGSVELAAPTPEAAPVATDYSELEEELFELYQNHDTIMGALLSIYDLGFRRCMNTSGRQHGAAQPPAPQPAPPAEDVGGLVQWVLRELPSGTDPSYARHAIRAVARWIRWESPFWNCSPLISRSVADRLEQEADR